MGGSPAQLRGMGLQTGQVHGRVLHSWRLRQRREAAATCIEGPACHHPRGIRQIAPVSCIVVFFSTFWTCFYLFLYSRHEIYHVQYRA